MSPPPCFKKKTTNKQKIEYKLVEPHYNSLNETKRCIQNFKSYFISDLYDTDSNFTIVFWDTILIQAQYTLSILRKSRSNSQLLSYEKLDGIFDFNKIPLSQQGTREVMYASLATRNTWYPNE